jgi:hypothetical protein
MQRSPHPCSCRGVDDGQLRAFLLGGGQHLGQSGNLTGHDSRAVLRSAVAPVGGGLRVKVDHGDGAAAPGSFDGQPQHDGGLAVAALLSDDGDDLNASVL